MYPVVDESFNKVLRDVLPSPAITMLEWITHLGDGAFLIAIALLLYWFGEESSRERRAFVIAVGLVALSLSVGLKGYFQLTRPDLAFSDGYPGFTFPSAHAMGAAALYTALALTMKTGPKRLRLLVAGVLIVLIGLSRIVLGVHYLADVIAGIVLGLAIVWVGFQFKSVVPEAVDDALPEEAPIDLSERAIFNPGPLFVLAFVLAVAAWALGSQVFLTMSVGAGLGGTVGWYAVRDRAFSKKGASILLLAIFALPLLFVVRAVDAIEFFDQHSLLKGTGYAIVTALSIAIPTLAAPLDDWKYTDRLQSLLHFRGRTFDPRMEQ